VTAAIKVKLPDETHRPHAITPDSVILTVNQTGTVFLNEIKVDSADDLHQKLKEISTVDPQPTLQILGDAETEFQYIGLILGVVKSVGFKTVHFVTQPEAAAGS
jgi:biopolymer transport protein ExbD